jgi:hypothetical protein
MRWQIVHGIPVEQELVDQQYHLTLVVDGFLRPACRNTSADSIACASIVSSSAADRLARRVLMWTCFCLISLASSRSHCFFGACFRAVAARLLLAERKGNLLVGKLLPLHPAGPPQNAG